MTTDAVGGVWNFSLELARGLRSRNVDVVLAVMGPAPSRSQRAAATGAVMGLEWAPYLLEWMQDPWREVEAAGEWLCNLERRWGCDLVHLNGYAHGACAFRAPKLVVGHSCVLSWWQAVRGGPAPPEWDRYRQAVRAGLDGAQQVVTPTRWMGTQLHHHYGLHTRITTVHNGRSARDFVASAKEPLVFAAGRVWDEGKNLQALGRVSARVPWPIHVAGPTAAPAAEGASGDAIARLGRAVALGELTPSAMARAYGAASIYALPARYEPFGLSIVEAALAGCALVVGDVPSLRELWDGAAIFVDPDHPGDLEDALLTLIGDAPERHAWSRRAQARARRYTQERMVEGYLAVYSRCWRDAPPSRPLTPTPTPTEELPCVS